MHSQTHPVTLNAGRRKMRTTTLLVGLALTLLLPTLVAADDKSGVDEDGFLQRWLVLAPIPFAANETGTDALDKEQLKDEAKLKPKVGDKLKVSDKEFVWKGYTCPDHLLDSRPRTALPTPSRSSSLRRN